MTALRYNWTPNGAPRALELVHVPGAPAAEPYLFGEPNAKYPVHLADFFIATTPVTQALWAHVMGAAANPACNRGDAKPLENISWDDITNPAGGFLATINAGPILPHLISQIPGASGRRAILRLPSETEWEYAARGGPHWRDDFPFSGGRDIDDVAWYDRNSRDRTHDVAGKAPNQLGLYDMSGNVWEWCQDCHTRVITEIPADGSPLVSESNDRVLRGGCFHNWAIHCTVSKRYEIARHFHDGCIGFRLALAIT
jgi:formylglycine-generating enzyme required for sulfatase activity